MAFFSDLLKKWFYTNSSSAASSDARIPLLNANGTPKGSDTMANLASVLGGKSTELYSGVDFNTLIDGKNYFGYGTVFASSSNTPNTTARTFKLFINKDTSESYIIQTCFMYSGELFVRTRNNDGIWTSWHTIAIDYPSFYKNYSTLADLVGGINGVNIQYDSGITDLNNVSHRYIWARFTNKPTNCPSSLNADGGFLLHVAINQASNKVQFMFDYNGAHGFFRTYWGSSWNAWVKMF